MSILIRVAMLLSITQSAFALAPAPKSDRCEKLLSAKSSPLDYALSDLEGAFFNLLAKVQAVHEVTPSRAEYFAKDVLNMKADILNRVLRMLPLVEKQEALESIYQIIESLGVPPKVYGLQVEDGRVVSKHLRAPSRQLAPPPAVKNRSIGFLDPSSEPGHDLPDGSHRSIGFGPQKTESYAPPSRTVGQFRRMITKEDQNTLIVVDTETETVYQASLGILMSFSAQFESHTLALQYNPEVLEWVVVMENLANPKGEIGFTPHH